MTNNFKLDKSIIINQVIYHTCILTTINFIDFSFHYLFSAGLIVLGNSVSEIGNRWSLSLEVKRESGVCVCELMHNNCPSDLKEGTPGISTFTWFHRPVRSYKTNVCSRGGCFMANVA